MTKKKTTMSVPEMQRLLGLGKTDAYWLIKKRCFATVVVSGKMRVVIDSFEHWYANQVKHSKVHGPPPGKELRAKSYSPQELAEELGVALSTIYDIIKRCHIETFEVDTWMRISKDVFKKWYKAQHKYRTQADRARDAALEADTLTMPEVARLLQIPRKDVYTILLYGKDRHQFEFVTIGDRRRVTKASFDRWYANQTRFRKVGDTFPSSCTKIDKTKSAFSMQETAILLSVTYQEVREMIHNGELAAKKCGKKFLIPRDEIQWILLQRKNKRKI